MSSSFRGRYARLSLAPGVEGLGWGEGGGDGEVLGRIAEGPASTFRPMPSPLATLLPWVSSVHVRLVRLLVLALGPDLSVAGVQVGAFRLRPSPPSLLLQRPVLLREVSPLMVFRSWSRYHPNLKPTQPIQLSDWSKHLNFQ